MPYQKIRRKRQERGLSQDDMADRLGISASTYSKLERGKTRIDTDRLKQIAEVLEMDAVDFLGNDTIVVTHNNAAGYSNNGVVIYPSASEMYERMISRLDEEIAAVKNENSVLRKENDRLLGLVERLTESSLNSMKGSG